MSQPLYHAATLLSPIPQIHFWEKINAVIALRYYECLHNLVSRSISILLSPIRWIHFSDSKATAKIYFVSGVGSICSEAMLGSMWLVQYRRTESTYLARGFDVARDIESKESYDDDKITFCSNKPLGDSMTMTELQRPTRFAD